MKIEAFATGDITSPLSNTFLCTNLHRSIFAGWGPIHAYVSFVIHLPTLSVTCNQAIQLQDSTEGPNIYSHVSSTPSFQSCFSFFILYISFLLLLFHGHDYASRKENVVLITNSTTQRALDAGDHKAAKKVTAFDAM